MWCWLLLVAGLETTGNLIAAGLHLLLRNPEQRDRAVADPGLIRPAVAEMLRIVTPGRYIRRTATADTELGGHAIRQGRRGGHELHGRQLRPGDVRRPARASTSTATPTTRSRSPTARTAASGCRSRAWRARSPSRSFWRTSRTPSRRGTACSARASRPPSSSRCR